MIPKPSERRRRSILRLPETKGKVLLSYWRSLLIANGVIVLVVIFLSLTAEVPLNLPGLVATVGIWMLYCTVISSIAYYTTILVEARRRTLSRTARGGLLAAAWMMSGVIGSGIAYAILALLTGENQGFARSWVPDFLISNGIVALAIGTAILLFGTARKGYRRRTELLGQHDLLAAEFRAARSVQQRLLPDGPMRLFGFQISSASEPAVEIGGDYYDYLSFADGTKGIVVADAAGKGIPAALVMAKFQGMAQALSIHVADPNDFFVGLNDTLRVRLDRQNFITVGLLTIDFEDCCTFYRAGHNPMLLCRASTGETEILRPSGMALGLSHGDALSRSLEGATFRMENGDVALLYSDGLTEAMRGDGEMFDEERVIPVLAEATRQGLSADEIRAVLFSALAEFVGDAEPTDDITLVVVRKT